MIKQAAIGLSSIEEANPYNKEGFLPLITSPIESIVNENNYQVFKDNNIQLCFPTNTKFENIHNDTVYKDSFHTTSLNQFKYDYIENKRPIGSREHRRCIDTPNGNSPELYEAIRKAKEIHGDNLIIMAGNVSSVEAFVELAKTGVDYIRVGIDGEGGCNTTSNTGVGQGDLERLITNCKGWVQNSAKRVYEYNSRCKNAPEKHTKISKVKIVADGISTYIKQCESKYGFNDNGYAAINTLLDAGADLIMIDKLFAQCLESAGEKLIKHTSTIDPRLVDIQFMGNLISGDPNKFTYADFINDKVDYTVSKYLGEMIPVRWTLHEWLEGWINSVKLYMMHTGKTKLTNE